MSKELHPISFYINDREEMLNQMFSTMKEDKFRAMLPPILKGMPVDELKKCCLEELLGMSSKRIHSIVAGRELLSSSDSEDLELSVSENEESLSVEDSDSDSSASCPSKSRRVSKDARTEDTLQIAISSEEVGDLLQETSAPRRRSADKLRRPHRRTEPNVKPKRSKHPQPAAVGGVNGQTPTTPAAQPEKTLLEMLELELRARAIRAALTHQEKINLLDNREVPDTGIVIEIKEETEKTAKELGSSKANVDAQTSKDTANQSNDDAIGNQVKNKGATAETMTPTKDSDVEIVCEEISSDEAMFDDEEDGEPELIEPVIESIVISSDSEPEKPEEKQESWKERWMQKKDISSVMKASKLITNVKRKMKRDKTDKIALAQAAAQEAQEKTQQITLVPPPTVVIQGTVSEFNLLPPATTSLASVVEQSSVEQPAAEQTPAEPLAAEQIPAEQTPAEHTSVEHSVDKQANIDQPVEEQMPIQQPTVEPSQESQQTKEPIKECINEQLTTDATRVTEHETGKAVLAHGEVEASTQSAAIVEEPITTQSTAIQLTCTEQKEKRVGDLQTSVDSSAVTANMAALTSLPAAAADESCPELPHVKQSLTEQPVDKEMVKSVKRKKKREKSDKKVKSQVKRVPTESRLASTVSREQSNVVAPQLNASEGVEVVQYASRKELKKVKREKKSKGDKMKRPHGKKMQSAVSKVSVDDTSSSTTTSTKVSRSKQLGSNRTTFELDVTEPSED